MSKNIQFIYYSSSGTLPNLTKSNLSGLNVQNLMLMCQDFWRMREVFSSFPRDLDFRKYYSLNQALYLSPIDPSKQRNRGCQKSDKVELDDFGFKEYSNKEYLALSQLIRPDFVITLTEQPRKGEAVGKKSIKRNTEKSLNFLQETIELKLANNLHCDIIASFQGGFNQEFREQSFEAIKENLKYIKGVIVYDIFSYFNEEFSSFDSRRDYIYQHTKTLPDDCHKILSEDGSFTKILEAEYFGFTHFSVFTTFSWAKQGQGIYFDSELWLNMTKYQVENNIEVEEKKVLELFAKNKGVKSIDIKNKAYEKDMSGVVLNCQCYCCKNHSRSYLNHLFKHNEMTGAVLMTIHNMHVAECFRVVLSSEQYQKHKAKFIKSFYFLFCE